MNQKPDCVAIVGVGLLGASLGLALKERGLAKHIIGVGRRQSSLNIALERGAIDSASMNIADAARAANLLVIATPAALVAQVMDEARMTARPDLIVTDVASTKADICCHASATWSAPRRFVGSHPMTGGEKFGPEHGRADLYENTICLLEESPDIDPEAHSMIRSLWEAVGAKVVSIEPESHDRMLANTSHLPHVAASAVAALAAEQGASSLFIGNGFRDMTRIAEGHPEIWRDICMTNRAALLNSLSELQNRLGELSAILAAGDAVRLEAFFEAGREGRRKVVE